MKESAQKISYLSEFYSLWLKKRWLTNQTKAKLTKKFNLQISDFKCRLFFYVFWQF